MAFGGVVCGLGGLKAKTVLCSICGVVERKLMGVLLLQFQKLLLAGVCLFRGVIQSGDLAQSLLNRKYILPQDASSNYPLLCIFLPNNAQ